MNLLPLAFTCSWASGVNCYLVVLALGLADRMGHFGQIPDIFGLTPVLAVAAVLYAAEFVVDKIPYLDSTWDAISTAIRPVVGALIAVLLAHHEPAPLEAAYAVLGGGTALASHAVKAGSRLLVNTSPEPVTNLVTSLGEDGVVLGVVLLSIRHPWPAAAISALLLTTGLAMLGYLLHSVRRGWRRWKRRPTVVRPRTP